MKETDQELLSRILDEDVSEFETQRILKEMSSSVEHRNTLQRYNLIGHAIRKELPVEYNTNFADQVMAKLDNDQTQDLITTEEFKSINANSASKTKTMVGLAIAASVAVFSFVTLQDFLQPNTDSDQAQTPVVAERVIEESDIQRVSVEELQNFASNPEAAAEFNSYIVNHAEYASPRASMPHVRIVGYDQEQ